MTPSIDALLPGMQALPQQSLFIPLDASISRVCPATMLAADCQIPVADAAILPLWQPWTVQCYARRICRGDSHALVQFHPGDGSC